MGACGSAFDDGAAYLFPSAAGLSLWGSFRVDQ